MLGAPRRKREASKEEFQQLLRQLNAGEPQAWALHEVLHQKLAWFFERDFPLQAEELADEVIGRLARKLSSDDIGNIAEFAFGIARNLRREHIRHCIVAARLPTALGTQEAPRASDAENSLIAQLDDRTKLRFFIECVERLPKSDRKLLLDYYPSHTENLELSRQEIARELGVNMGTLRTRVARLREQLELEFERMFRKSR